MSEPDDRDKRREAAAKRAEEGVEERLLQRRARERERDRQARRPEHGLFTGRGRHERYVRDEDTRDGHSRKDRTGSRERSARPRDDERARPRTGAKRTVMGVIRQLPAYLRLLLGLLSDSRVSKIDRFFVLAAVAYVISPLDFIPDVIPFLGEVDDVFLLMLALQRLVNNAGRSVLLAHWRGDPDDIHDLTFARIVSAAGFFLPSQLKRRLFKMAGVGKRSRDP